MLKKIFLIITSLLAVACQNQETIYGKILMIHDKEILVETRETLEKILISFDQLEQDYQLNDQIKVVIKDKIKTQDQIKATGIAIKKIINYQKITKDEAVRLINEEKAILLDVRTEAEYQERHLDNSILLPLASIKAKVAEKILDKEQIIIVYCRSGNRSKQAAKILLELGYQRVYDLGSIDNYQ